LRDHYAALGLEPGAGAEEVRAAYRRLAKTHHPDVSAEPDARERFDAVREAYEALSDPGRKAAYDALLAEKAARQRRLTREEKDRLEAEDLRRKAEERMRDVPRPRQPDPESTKRLTALLAGGRLAEAEAMARRMVADEPRQALPHAVLGDVAWARGDLGRAATHYAYAAQFDPTNLAYQRKHEQLLGAAGSTGPDLTSVERANVGVRAVAVTSFVVLLAAVYAAWAPEPALGWVFAPAWTLAIVAMLAVCGVAVGASLSLTGTVQRLSVAQGSAVTKLNLVLAVALLAVASFWAAVLVYGVVTIRQSAGNRSLSALLGGCGAAVGAFSLVVWARSDACAVQSLAWGGNVAVLGALVGWGAADALRRA
jgi:curved DNA-binding protein CbpA